MEDTITLKSSPDQKLKLHDKVMKIGGDYTFIGDIRSLINKRSGQVRYAVENDQGLVHIFSGSQLISLK